MHTHVCVCVRCRNSSAAGLHNQQQFFPLREVHVKYANGYCFFFSSPPCRTVSACFSDASLGEVGGGGCGCWSVQVFECRSPTLQPRIVVSRCNTSGEGNAGGLGGGGVSCAAHSARGERQCQALGYSPAHSAAAAALIPAFALSPQLTA